MDVPKTLPLQKEEYLNSRYTPLVSILNKHCENIIHEEYPMSIPKLAAGGLPDISFFFPFVVIVCVLT